MSTESDLHDARGGHGLRLAARLFAAMLWLLPAAVRREYGPAMRAEFITLAAQRGGVWRTFLQCTIDLLTHLPHEWRMTRRMRERAAGPSERMLTMWMELMQAARSLAKRPGFTIVTVLTLALGIGANVAIFAIVHTVLVKPLPFPEPDDIVVLQHHAPGLGFEDLENSPATLTLYLEHARSFSAVAGTVTGERNLASGREPARVPVVEATPSLFDVLRVTVALGRPLIAADAQPGAAPVAVLTHVGWQKYFGGASDIIGMSVDLNDTPTQIVGVLRPDFRYPDGETALLVPLEMPDPPVFGDFGTIGLARLAPGVDIEAAEAEVKALQTRLTEDGELDASWLERAQWAASLQTLRDRTVGEMATTLWIVFGTVSFLLLVACASVANLFLVRAEARQKEVGIRLALGATRARVAATFMYESLLLGIAGGAWGLALGAVAVRALVSAGPRQVPRIDEVSIDGTVLLFTAIVSLTSGVLFGALPLLRRGALAIAGIAGGTRGATAGRDRQRVRKVLIVAQLALAIVLLTGSGLMLRSFQRLRAVDFGIRPEGVLTVGISVGEGRSKEQAAALYQQMLDAVGALPGVTAHGLTNALPLDPRALNGGSYWIESRPRAEGALPPITMFGVISSGFLEATGTALVRGRAIERADDEHGRDVALINEEFMRVAFDGQDPVGERIKIAGDTAWLEIIGVVRDVRILGAREEIRPLTYLPMTTSVSGARTGLMHLAVHTDGDPMALAQPVLAAVRSVDGNVPLLTVRTMQDVARDSIAQTSFTMMILLVAAVVSLLLGAIGLYGVIGYVVSQRTREIGLRLALGAMPVQVRRMVLRQGLHLAGAGIALGLAGAMALTRVLESLLFEVDARDPATFLIVPALLLGVSAVAAWLPARRASAIAPMQAMNTE